MKICKKCNKTAYRGVGSCPEDTQGHHNWEEIPDSKTNKLLVEFNEFIDFIDGVAIDGKIKDTKECKELAKKLRRLK